MKRLTLRIPDIIHDYSVQFSELIGLSVNQMILAALYEYLHPRYVMPRAQLHGWLEYSQAKGSISYQRFNRQERDSEYDVNDEFEDEYDDTEDEFGGVSQEEFLEKYPEFRAYIEEANEFLKGMEDPPDELDFDSFGS